MNDFSDSEISDFTVINSDDDLPTDSTGDLSIVSLKGIIKEIIESGQGYDKPGIGDEVFIEFYQNENLPKKLFKMILGNSNEKNLQSTSSLEIPWCIELALRKMLIGERSKIFFPKNSIFSQPRINGKSNIDHIISLDDYKNYNNRSRKLINLIKKNNDDFDHYYVKLLNFCHIENITEKIQKKIWKEGINIRSINQSDSVEICISNLTSTYSSKFIGMRPNFIDYEDFNWMQFYLDLENYQQNQSLIDISNQLKFNLSDLILSILSMKISEISEIRFYNSYNETINVLIQLKKCYWKKKVELKVPLKYTIKDNYIYISSNHDEKSLIIGNNKSVARRISSINFNYNNKLNINFKKFSLVNLNNSMEYNLDLPIKSNNKYKSINLLLIPGFYTMPLWLEYSLKHCFLGGEYTINIPYSLIFFFPPKELFINKKTDIQNYISPMIFLNNGDNSSKLTSSTEDTYWDVEILIDSLKKLDLFLINQNNIDSSNIIFKLEFNIDTKEIIENYLPLNLINIKKEFDFYNYIKIIFNEYIDKIYNIKWNLLILEILEKLMYIVQMIPSYSKLFINKDKINIKKISDLKYENDNNMHVNNGINNNIQNNMHVNDGINNKNNLITLKYLNMENLNNENFTKLEDKIINGLYKNKEFNVEFIENEEIKNLINIITLIQEISIEINDYEKCIEYYNKYDFIIKFIPKNIYLTIIAAKKSGKYEYYKRIIKETSYVYNNIENELDEKKII